MYFLQIHLCDLNPNPESKKKKICEDDSNEEVKTLLFHFGMSGCFQFTPGNYFALRTDWFLVRDSFLGQIFYVLKTRLVKSSLFRCRFCLGECSKPFLICEALNDAEIVQYPFELDRTSEKNCQIETQKCSAAKMLGKMDFTYSNFGPQFEF